MSQIKLQRLSSGVIDTSQFALSGSLSSYSLTSHTHPYLPLSGGLLTGSLTGTFIGDGSGLTGIPTGSTTSYAKFGVTIDGGGITPLTGFVGYSIVPYSCTAVDVTLLASESGNIVVDITKGDFSTFPTSSSIASATPPTLINNIKYQDTTLDGWTKVFNEGDILGFSINSISALTKCWLTLRVIK